MQRKMPYMKSNFLINSQYNIGIMPRVSEFAEFGERKWKGLTFTSYRLFHLYIFPEFTLQLEITQSPKYHLISLPTLEIPLYQNLQSSLYTK